MAAGRDQVTPLVRVRWLSEALALRALWALAALLPVDAASRTGRALLRRLGPRTAKHRHVKANLRIVRPQADAAEIERLARDVWGNTGAVLAEFAKLPVLIDPDRTDARVESVHPGTQGAPPGSDSPCVFVSAHLSNWEMIGHAIQRAAPGLQVVYNMQQNPWLERLVQHRRRVLGVGYVEKLQSLRRLRRTLKDGKSVGLLIDVRVDGGTQVPFFDVPAETTTAPAWLALKSGCPIVPVRAQRLEDARYRVTFYPALSSECRDGETEAAAIQRVTAELNQVLEQWISAAPGDWWCTKRRWPKALMRARGAYAEDG